jgi:hypothetical protein
MNEATWVKLAPLIEPITAFLASETGKPAEFLVTPKGKKPPFTVWTIVSDPRPLLTMDGGVPAEVTFQLDNLGVVPLQALGLHDKTTHAMLFADAPELPGATIDYREAAGDGHADKNADGLYVWQTRFTWCLIGSA